MVGCASLRNLRRPTYAALLLPRSSPVFLGVDGSLSSHVGVCLCEMDEEAESKKDGLKVEEEMGENCLSDLFDWASCDVFSVSLDTG